MLAKETTEMQHNRTGAANAPVQAVKAATAAARTETAQGAEAELEEVRMEFVRETEGVGTLPEPMKLASAPNYLRGLRQEQVMVLLDKLGQRAAFERTGARIYDALIAKVSALEEPGKPPVEELRDIRDEEVEHFKIVARQMALVGGDPTAETPCADASSVASSGVVKVVSDPRTTIAQSLDAVLTAELTDHAGWELLISLAKGLGLADMASAFEEPLRAEQRHLEKVRGWLSQGLMARVQ